MGTGDANVPYAKAPNQMVAARWIEKGKKENIPGDCPPELKTLLNPAGKPCQKRPTAIQVVERLKPLVTTSKNSHQPRRLPRSERRLTRTGNTKLKDKWNSSNELAHEQQLAAAA